METNENASSGNREESNVSNLSKREIKSFGELLAHFPMIARQMQPGLERVFHEFSKELGKPLPIPPSGSPMPTPSDSAKADVAEGELALSPVSTNQDRLPFNSSEYFEDDEDLLRRTLETAVTSAIDLFRLVDKQQLSLLGATTDLTGPLVERLIERHVTEQVHDSLLFPRLCGFRQAEDSELDTRIRQMENIDVSQVGIGIEGGKKGKDELIHRLGKGVEEFRKIVDAKCPQDMLTVLLTTMKAVTIVDTSDTNENTASTNEKQASVTTVNADVLVSLLLIVIIRSQVRHLQARLLYMQQYIYIDDVESGENGYALSTFEAVLTYLARDSGGLRRASVRNKRLWSATKAGRVSDMKAILEPDDQSPNQGEEEQPAMSMHDGEEEECLSSPVSRTDGAIPDYFGHKSVQDSEMSEEPRLAHVFPFQTWRRSSPTKETPPPQKKRVSMDTRSLSESSTTSFLSRTTTLGSIASGLEGDTSIENLTKTQNPSGDSVLMMAIEGCKPEALRYLLDLEEFFSPERVMEDTNGDGTTLLSAAVQLAHTELVNILLEYLYRVADHEAIRNYFTKTDTRGRTVAHYLFSVPSLMARLGCALPWRQKDKNGQTPLFALCRSYDHPDYSTMVEQALFVAQEDQGDGNPLRLDDHVDARGNTLLHVISDPRIIHRILRECDCDPNATNDKRFTPLMMASKYGRVDLVRTLFGDPRVDVFIRELRGFTAIELAKDDEVRNRIDDLVLFSNSPPSPESSGRITTVVRSLFVEDGTVRFIIKSGSPNLPTPSSALHEATTYTVTTCRRGITDFENLIKFLRIEHPASYVPDLPLYRSPFQIPPKPSRAVLHGIQQRVDMLLKIFLAHPTFATHEMLWEFFLVPEIQTNMLEERSRRKADALAEKIADDYEPVTKEGLRDVEQVVSQAQDVVRGVSISSQSVIRRGHNLEHSFSDFADALGLCAHILSSFQFPRNNLLKSHFEAVSRYAASVSTASVDSTPLVQFLVSLESAQSTTAAMLNSLSRPGKLISNLNSTHRSLARAHSSLATSSLPRKFNFPGLEESRQRSMRDLEQKIVDWTADIEQVGKEISWNRDVVVGELAAWTSWRERVSRDAIRTFAKATLVREKERGKRLERCLRSIKSSS